MVYTKYFKPGQKILLRFTDSPGRFEALTAIFQQSESGFFDLILAPQNGPEESYPFADGMPVTLMSDHLGLGLRVTGCYHKHLADNRIRVKATSDLQVFQRRLNRRLDTSVGLRYSKGRGTLRSFREQWEKNLKILDKTTDFSKLPPFPRAGVNLSVGGLRFELAPPVEVADHCLILLQPQPDTRPVCALTEVVWLKDTEKEHRRIVGMQFIGILDSDQKRIETLIQQPGTLIKAPKQGV